MLLLPSEVRKIFTDKTIFCFGCKHKLCFSQPLSNEQEQRGSLFILLSRIILADEVKVKVVHSVVEY